ncbi:MAG TPA: transglutaminaseTgpA domain-containing protein [Opitutales bacterium]|jgi:transglutaminase-like putative cysteine protease|nr:transglutaminaseTgpA domain-containing protein [Opitutales bacterium]
MSSLAANLRARLNRDELHQLRWLLGLVLVLLAFWTLFGLDFGGLAWRMLFFVTAALALAFPGLPGRIPNWVRRWALILGAAALFTQFIATQFDIISGLVLLVSLLALSRGLQYRRIREDWQLVLLCLFIIILVGVMTLSLLFGLQIMIFTIVTMALLFVMNLLERDAGRALVRADWANFKWLRFLGRVRGALDMRQLFMAAGLFAGLVAVSTVIFISMPRYQFEQSFNFASQRGVSGFHNDISYKEQQGLDNDDSIALRVDPPPGAARLDTTPYWRMIVLDAYDASGFHVSSALQKGFFGNNLTVHYPPENRPAPEGRTRLTGRNGIPELHGDWDFYLEGNVSEYLPVLGPFDSLTFGSTQAFAAFESVKVYRTETPSTKVLGYRVENMDFGDAIPAARNELNGNITLEKADARPRAIMPFPWSYFSLPTQKSAQQTLTDRQILDGIRDKILDGVAQAKGVARTAVAREDYLNAVIDYLRKNHNADMNVNLADTEKYGHDLLIRWLNAPQTSGWCEYYSGAFVLLARDAGYPARVVAGYRGAEYNEIKNYYVVRQSFAHAWAEVYNGSDRWVRYDPTPGAPSNHPGLQLDENAAGIVSENGWAAFFDSLRMIWYRRVINFDQTDQEAIVDQAKKFGTDFADWVQQWFTAIGATIAGWFTGPLSPLRAGVIVVGLVVMLCVWRWRAALRNAWLKWGGKVMGGQARRMPPIRLDAGRWLRRFQPAWQTCAPQLPAPERAQWDGVHRDLLALRYGPLDHPADPAGTFQRARVLLRNFRKRKMA